MTTALHAINCEPQLNWMSAPARALLAVALADGRPLRVITVLDDAAILVHAEHEIRCESIRLRDALDRARMTSIDEPTLRGIARFAAALSDDSAELDALLMEHGARDARSLTREQAVRIAIELFARKEAPRGITFEQLVDAFPQDDVAPAELVDDPGAGVLVGRCHECNGAVHAGAATIAIGWSPAKPAWQPITPSVERTEAVKRKLVSVAERIGAATAAAGRTVYQPERASTVGPAAADEVADVDVAALRAEFAGLQRTYEAALAKPQRAGTKLARLLDGDLLMLCTSCWVALKYTDRDVRPPNPSIEAIAPVSDAPGSLPRDGEHAGQPGGTCGDSAVPSGGAEVAGGLIDRGAAIAIAIKAIDADHRRVARMMSSFEFAGDDAELRYRILALAWERDRPIRIQTVPDDRRRLDELVDLALRGGSVERELEWT